MVIILKLNLPLPQYNLQIISSLKVAEELYQTCKKNEFSLKKEKIFTEILHCVKWTPQKRNIQNAKAQEKQNRDMVVYQKNVGLFASPQLLRNLLASLMLFGQRDHPAERDHTGRLQMPQEWFFMTKSISCP